MSQLQLLDVRWHCNTKMSPVTKVWQPSSSQISDLMFLPARTMRLARILSDAEVGQSANRVVGHAWRSIDGAIFKEMVDKGWYDQHPDMVVHKGVNWLKEFYSHINQSELFEVDITYLKESDTWLKEEAAGEYLGSDEEDE
ncbi:hypothetical protein J3A83DRAFT_4188736 [Scleroderma citrinum]